MKGKLLLIFLLALLTFSPRLLTAHPEGELYWIVEDYPDISFPHTTTETYNGAENAIDYACTQNAGIGTYSGNIQILNSSMNFPAQKGGYCQNSKPFFPGTFNGNFYVAFLYCNGEKRELMDDTPCAMPPESLIKERNLGPFCPDE